MVRDRETVCSDFMKIKTSGWLEKKKQREMHDIPRVQGFNWLANGKMAAG
jgi:hypothetical protein